MASVLAACGGGGDDDASAAPGLLDNGTTPNPQNASPNRSISVAISHHIDGATLQFGQASRNSGSLPQATPERIAAGDTMAVAASAHNASCNGSFSLAAPSKLSGTALRFDLRYTHPYGTGATTVQIEPSPGGVAGTDAQTYSGHHATARVNLYQGVATGSGAWVAPLGLLAATPTNNCQDFVNSLFGPGIRSAAAINAAMQATSNTDLGYLPPADFTGGQMVQLVALWVRHWMGTTAADVLPATDVTLLDLLKDYIARAANNGPLTLWVPQISHQTGTAPAVYALQGYRPFVFFDATGAWQPATVSAFLTLLTAGSHIVPISANSDLPAGVTVQPFNSFFSTHVNAANTRHDVGNSHYALAFNATGYYYLNVSGNFAPPNCGLLLAFLFGRTVNSLLASAGSYNLFLQLEGWQADAARHQADYALHQQTLWNISTLGASPYSEKRATTIFLAPGGWTPHVYRETRMMAYAGAYAQANGAAQPWLRTDLVTIADNAPALPARYFN